jgi:hypothetical protein
MKWLFVLTLLSGVAVTYNSDNRMKLAALLAGRPMAQERPVQISPQPDDGGRSDAGRRLMDLLRRGDMEAARRQYEADREAFGLQPPASPAPRAQRPPLRSMTMPPEAQ